jgi:ATP-dependent Lon protease
MSTLRWKSLAQFRMEVNQRLSNRAKKLLTDASLARASPDFLKEEEEIARIRQVFSTKISNSWAARLEKSVRNGYPINDDMIQEMIEVSKKEKEEIIAWTEERAKELFPAFEKIKEKERKRKRLDKEVKNEMEREKKEFEKNFG